MNIILTEIKDVSDDVFRMNIIKEKFVSDTIKMLYPILTEEYQIKREEKDKISNDTSIIKNNISSLKAELKSLTIELDKEKRLKKFMDKINLLEKSGLLLSYGNLRREVLTILKTVEGLDDLTIDRHSNNINKILKKRLNRS